jgi:hypothetical protein
LSASVTFASSSSSALNIYPNPARSQLTVYFKEPALYKAEILFLYNALGQQISRYDLSSLNNPMQLNTGHLQQGIYYLVLGKEKLSFLKAL